MIEGPTEAPEYLRKMERFYTEHQDMMTGHAWFYRAREGVFGPFESRELAEADLAELVYNSPSKREQYVQ